MVFEMTDAPTATPSSSDEFLSNLDLKPLSWNKARDQGVTPWSAPASFGPELRRCSAIARQSGQTCNRYTPLGHKVCRMHGGPGPDASVLEAKSKLKNLAHDAIARLAACLSEGPACQTCGRADNDRDPAVIRAAQIVLDRSGFGPTSTLAVGPAGDMSEQAWLSYLTEDEQATMADIVAKAKEREAKAREEE